MSYLDIARAVITGCEKSELSEKSPDVDILEEDFRQHKPAIRVELLTREIVDAASTAGDAFDRQHYDRLWADWHAWKDEEMT